MRLVCCSMGVLNGISARRRIYERKAHTVSQKVTSDWRFLQSSEDNAAVPECRCEPPTPSNPPPPPVISKLGRRPKTCAEYAGYSIVNVRDAASQRWQREGVKLVCLY
jgi:hypothetical protein